MLGSLVRSVPSSASSLVTLLDWFSLALAIYEPISLIPVSSGSAGGASCSNVFSCAGACAGGVTAGACAGGVTAGACVLFFFSGNGFSVCSEESDSCAESCSGVFSTSWILDGSVGGRVSLWEVASISTVLKISSNFSDSLRGGRGAFFLSLPGCGLGSVGSVIAQKRSKTWTAFFHSLLYG